MKGPSFASRIIIWWVCIFALILIICIPAWPGEFAYDEFRTVVTNPCTTGDASLSRLFGSDLWCLSGSEATASYRPVPALWARALHGIAGADVVVFRLGNLFLYSIITGLFAMLLVRLGLPIGAVTGGTALFAVMGVHLEAALSAAAISDLMFTLFTMLAILWSLSEKRWTSGGVVLGCCMFLLALLSKESALALVPALIVIDIIRSPKEAVSVKRRVAFYLVCALVIAGYLCIRFKLFGQLGVTVYPQDNPLAETRGLETIYGALAALGKGLCLICIPGMWSLEHAGCTIQWEYAVVGIVWLLGSVGIFFWGFHKRNLPLLLAVVLYWVGVGVSSNLFMVSPSLLAERQLLLASAGVVLLILLAARYLYSRFGQTRRYVVLFLALFILLQAGSSMLRASDWSSEENLYRSAVVVCPGSYKMQVNLAHWLRTHGGCLEAALRFESLLKDATEDDRFYLLRELGYSRHLCAQYGSAIKAYKEALEMQPDPILEKLILSAQHKNIQVKFIENRPFK